jgi:hypothetical protein
MFRITRVKYVNPKYEIKIMTDRDRGKGCLYYMASREDCIAAAQKSADELQGLKVCEWQAQANNPRVAVVSISVQGGGFLVASEIGPGNVMRWTAPVGLVAVIA